ncbi:MAG: DUF3786 domain-containing protein [Desulfocapsaceae bacterium]|nr:DUF3786 domain-containing protein [Desulfocapsaceae bacterium]
MTQPANAMEIFTQLEKSNCRECGEKTCLAFAAAVFQARKGISQCPRVDPETIQRYEAGCESVAQEEFGDQYIENLKNRFSQIDLVEIARRIGAEYDGKTLTLHILGKRFGIDVSGKFITDIHVNPYVAAPFLEYIVHSKGIDPTGEWVSFRELREGRSFSYPFFQKRCELVLKNIADAYPDLFDDLVRLFSAQKVPTQFESDVSVILYPLPKVPIMICYWMEDEGMDSTLNLFFDKSADENLPEGSLFTLCVGLALMFEKISQHHKISK